MPHSVDEGAEESAERLEREARDAISEFRLESDRAAGEALAIRAASEGEGHLDPIWALSLWTHALRRKYRPESSLEARHAREDS